MTSVIEDNYGRSGCLRKWFGIPCNRDSGCNWVVVLSNLFIFLQKYHIKNLVMSNVLFPPHWIINFKQFPNLHKTDSADGPSGALQTDAHLNPYKTFH